VHHLEICELGLIPGLGERVEAGLDQRGDAPAEHRLLTEEIGLGLLGKCGLEHSRARPADATCIGEGALARVAGRVLVHGEETGHALAGDKGASHQVPRSLGGHHAHVDTRGRVDEGVANVEAVGEHQHLAGLQARRDGAVVQRALAGVRRQHHDHVGVGARLPGREHAQSLGLRCDTAAACLR